MSWICPKCETENPDRLKICEVCDSPRESSPVDKLKEKLKEKYSDDAYKSFIRYHYSLLASADQGNSVDQYKVGEWFFNKYSADCYKIAAIWFLAAAKQGNMAAQSKLALCYEEGYGVPKAKDAAIKWYNEAANKGGITARQRYLKLKYAGKIYEAVVRYRIELLWAADNGNRNSQYQLGEWFSCHNGQSSYREEAFSWYEKAAKSGQGDAMLKLGECYENGIGVYSNYSEAIKWYKKAAKGGNDSARLRLAKAYLYGGMVTKNVEEALKWYGLVGRGLNGADLYRIGYAYDKGDTISMNKTKAVEYYRQAAEKGNTEAQYSLGVCYEKGIGVSCDKNVARYWYMKAAEHGHTQAQQNVYRLSSNTQAKQGANGPQKPSPPKKEDSTANLIISFIFGTIYGLMGYYCLETLPWGIHIPEVWPNTYPTNLIICIIIGIVVSLFINKN